MTTKDLYEQAKDIVIDNKRPSMSYLQRHLDVSYNIAASLMDRLENEGIVSAPDASGRRKLLVTEKISHEKSVITDIPKAYIVLKIIMIYIYRAILVGVAVLLWFSIDNVYIKGILLLFLFAGIGNSLDKTQHLKLLAQIKETLNDQDNELYDMIVYKTYQQQDMESIREELNLTIDKMYLFLKRMEYDGFARCPREDDFIINQEAFDRKIEDNKFYKRDKDEKETKALLAEKERINTIIQKHLATLTKKYKQLVYTDDYGETHKEDFRKELTYFVDHVLFKNKSISDSEKTEHLINLLDIVENGVSECEENILSNNPYDFEKKCADILCQNGWEAKATQKSADQGIDVIASKDGITVALQCKLYSKPVGNKAVQEAFSGKSYYDADYAAVVTNNTFTKSARQLAKNCDVLLLNPEDLKTLDTLIRASA